MSFFKNQTITAFEKGTDAFFAGVGRSSTPAGWDAVLVEYWVQGWDDANTGSDEQGVELEQQADYHAQQLAFVA